MRKIRKKQEYRWQNVRNIPAPDDRCLDKLMRPMPIEVCLNCHLKKCYLDKQIPMVRDIVVDYLLGKRNVKTKTA